MPNNLQKFIYNLSSVSPLCFTFAILCTRTSGVQKHGQHMDSPKDCDDQ